MHIIGAALVGLAMVLVSSAATFAATLDQMAGQMILVGFRGDGPADASVKAVTKLIAQGRIGGVMYLKTNVKSLAAVRAMNKGFLTASPDLPPFIALDQEGGSIERLTRDVGFAEIPSARAVAASMSPDEAERLYTNLAGRLADLGFNLNFGPVVDLEINPDNPIIARYGRAYGKSAQVVADYAEAFVKGHRAGGVLTALKHFPGHGSSRADSHEGFVDITATWRRSELEPYHTLIADGLVDMVMAGHLYHADFAQGRQDKAPASLSPVWVGQVLRDQLGYSGVVVTDDMEMKAIRSNFSFKEAIERAVIAGDDILLYSNTADYHIGLADEIRAVLVAQAKADPAFAARLKQSYERILALKNRLD